MEEKDIRNTLVKIFKDNDIIYNNEYEVKKETKIFDELQIDSLSFVAIICELEDIYQIIIPEEKMNFDSYSTIQDLIEVVNDCMKGVDEHD